MDAILRDIVYAVRGLRRNTGLAAIAGLTLALGIGANTVVFGFVEALILRPLPVAQPASVFFVQTTSTFTHSFPNYRDLRDRNRTFSHLAGYRLASMAVDAGSGAAPTWGYLATGNYFELLGLQPAAGRFFGPGDDLRPGASPYAVLSYSSWQRLFAGDPQAVGRSIRINGLPYTVVGVAPRGFHGTEVFLQPDLWVPMMMQPQIEGRSWLDARTTSNTAVIGRARSGTTREQAEADLNALAAAMASENPRTNAGLRIRLTSPGFFGDYLRAPVYAFVFGVMALAALVLLATCANLASLLAVRVLDRARELAIRMSLGATRARILRLLALETLLLCLTAGTAGAAVAALVLAAFSRWQAPMALPIQFDVTPDAKVFGFALLVSLTAALLAVLTPARRLSRCTPHDLIRQAAGPAGLRRWNLRDALLGLQLALCCVLVMGCFVSLRGLTHALALPLGFEPRGVHVSGFDLGLARYTPVEGHALQARTLEAVRALPGVTEAAYASALPLTTDQSSTAVFAESAADFRHVNAIGAAYYHVSPGYFGLMRTRLVAGREFNAFDTPDSPRVAIVNETLARRLFGTVDAVSRRFRVGPGHDDLREIVGIVEDGKYFTLSEDPRPAVSGRQRRRTARARSWSCGPRSRTGTSRPGSGASSRASIRVFLFRRKERSLMPSRCRSCRRAPRRSRSARSDCWRSHSPWSESTASPPTPSAPAFGRSAYGSRSERSRATCCARFWAAPPSFFPPAPVSASPPAWRSLNCSPPLCTTPPREIRSS